MFRLLIKFWKSIWRPDKIITVNTRVGKFHFNISERPSAGSISVNTHTGEWRFVVSAVVVLVLVCTAFFFYTEKDMRPPDVIFDDFLYRMDETLFRAAFLYWRMHIGAEWLVTPAYAIMEDPDGILMVYTNKFLVAINTRIATIPGYEDCLAKAGGGFNKVVL